MVSERNRFISIVLAPPCWLTKDFEVTRWEKSGEKLDTWRHPPNGQLFDVVPIIGFNLF